VPELFADVFLSVDGSAHGTRSPAFFGFDGPDLLRWIDQEQALPRRSVMGRKTYEVLAALPEEYRDESWERMTRKPTLVFSRSLTRTAWPGVELTAEDAVGRVRQLKRADGPDLRTVGSLSLVQQFLDAGLVDHLRLMVFPLVIGETGQQPLFRGVGDVRLELLGQSVLDGRVVLLDYRPGGPPPYVG
jgi:dihydrofolate reductase